MDVQTFLAWEAMSRDTIDVKRVYVDICGDLVAGVMLSQIIYWWLPDDDGNTKLRVTKNDRLWLVKKTEDWWDECRLTRHQVRRVLSLLKELGVIETAVYRFAGSPTTHIRLVWPRLLDLISQYSAGLAQMESPESGKSKIRKAANRKSGKRQIENPESGQSLTENTTDTTSETSAENTTPTTGDAVGEDTPVVRFLIEKAGVWPDRARALHHVSLEYAVAWYLSLSKQDDIRNVPAVLTHHLSNGNEPPADAYRSISYQTYMIDYGDSYDYTNGIDEHDF